MAVPPYPPGSLDEALDLVASKVFPRPALDIRDARRRNFPIYEECLPVNLRWPLGRDLRKDGFRGGSGESYLSR